MNRFQMNRDVVPGFALGCRIQRAVGRRHQAVDKWKSPSCELRVIQRILLIIHIRTGINCDIL